MRTLIACDLHVGLAAGIDLLRYREPRARFAALTAAADRLVLLGDVVELTKAPEAASLELVRPLLRDIGRALGAGGEVVLVPGNHDRALIAGWLARRVALAEPPGLEEAVPADASPALERVAEWLAPARVRIAYPGVWVVPGVYATHGHYVDAHAALARPLGRVWPGWEQWFAPVPARASPADYERALAHAYGLLVASERRRHVEPPARRRERALVAASYWSSAVVPALRRRAGGDGVAVLSAGLIAFKLRTAGLAAMSEVIARLGVRAEHVVFGHVHRAGPLPSDDPARWRTPAGTRLLNPGSWLHSRLLGARSPASAYWPGRLVELDGSAPPRLLAPALDTAAVRAHRHATGAL